MRHPIITRTLGINPVIVGTQTGWQFRWALPPPTAGNGDRVLFEAEDILGTANARSLEF